VHRYSIPGAESFARLSRVSRNVTSRTFPSVAVEFFQANSRLFESLVSEDSSFRLTIDGTPDRRPTFVPDTYFNDVRIVPALGRAFDLDDSRSDSPPVALLSHRYWQIQHGGDSQVIGRIIQINDTAVQIVGVLPDNFHGFSLQQADLWL